MNRLLAVAIDIPNTLGTTVGSEYPTFGVLLSKILLIAGIAAGIIMIFMLIYYGFAVMSSAGSSDKKKLASAQNAIFTTLAGFLIIFASYFIIQIIQKITNVPILE